MCRSTFQLSLLSMLALAVGCAPRAGDGGAADLGGAGEARDASMSNPGSPDAGSPDLSSPDSSTGGDVVDELLALTASCTTANMVSAHTYADPGSMVNDVPICALKGALFFNADMDIDCDGR